MADYFYVDSWLDVELIAGVGNRGVGGGIPPLAEKILKIPPLRIWKKYTPPPSAARSAAAIFLAKFWKLTLI